MVNRYDGLNRHIATEVTEFNQETGGTTGITRTGYVLDGMNPVLDINLHPVNTKIDRAYLLGPAVNEVLAVDVTDSSITRAVWTFADPLGTARSVAWYDGTAGTWSFQHRQTDAFGNLYALDDLHELTAAPSDPILNDVPRFWAGHRFDVVTGLYDMKARWYDPQSGRMLSNDPLSFNAGDANLSRYVNNSPVNGVDPDGQVANVAIGAGIGAAFGAGSYLVHWAITGGEFNSADFLISTTSGAIAGAVGGATFGLGLIASGAAAGATGGALGGGLTAYSRGASGSEVAKQAAIGGVVGGFAGAAGGAVTGKIIGGYSAQAAIAAPLWRGIAADVAGGATGGAISGGWSGYQASGTLAGTIKGAAFGALEGGVGAGIGSGLARGAQEGWIYSRLRSMVMTRFRAISDPQSPSFVRHDDRAPALAAEFDARTRKFSMRENKEVVDLDSFMQGRVNEQNALGSAKPHHGDSGTHAEVLAASDLMTIRRQRNMDVNSQALSEVRGYVIALKDSRRFPAGSPFKMCENCATILPEIAVFTGRYRPGSR